MADKRIKELKDYQITSLEDLTDDDIKCIINKRKKIVKEKVKKKDIETDTKQYKVLLKLTNKFLMCMYKKNINRLDEFQMIDRLDIIKIPKTILEGMDKELYKRGVFKKGQFYYNKDTVNYNLNVLRNLCRQLGMKLMNYKKDMSEQINNKYYRKTHRLYSIENI